MKLIIAIRNSEKVAITRSIKTVEVASAVDKPFLLQGKFLQIHL